MCAAAAELAIRSHFFFSIKSNFKRKCRIDQKKAHLFFCTHTLKVAYGSIYIVHLLQFAIEDDVHFIFLLLFNRPRNKTFLKFSFFFCFERTESKNDLNRARSLDPPCIHEIGNEKKKTKWSVITFNEYNRIKKLYKRISIHFGCFICYVHKLHWNLSWIFIIITSFFRHVMYYSTNIVRFGSRTKHIQQTRSGKEK